MKTLTDPEILYGIRHKDNDVLEYIYSRYFPAVLKFVKDNEGDEQDARDLFQDAVISVFKKLREGKLHIKASFSSYFLVMCRFLWYDTKGSDSATRNKLKGQLEGSVEEPLAEEREVEGKIDAPARGDAYLRKEKIYQRHYRNLAFDCKKVLTMFYRKHSYDHIAFKMGYGSSGYARRKKYLCWRHLMKNIKNDKEFKRIMKERRDDEV